MDWAAFTAVSLAVAAFWVVRGVLFPWIPCPNCEGSSKFRDGKAWRSCRRCGGTGKRVRPIRRVVGWFIRPLRM